MAGFNTLVDDFNVATCELHLKNPAGQPAYAVQSGDSVDIAVGSWDITRDENGNEMSRKPMPPEIKGAEVRPCILVLRSPNSPDAKEFRKTHKCKLTFEDIMGLTLDKAKKPIIPDEKMARIWWGSFIADFKDLPHEEKGVTALAEYTEQNALDFMDNFPGIAVQMQRVLFDVENFGKPLATG